MNSEPGIILFIFNRPEHTANVLEGLKKNKIEKLYVFSDGSRNENDVVLVEQTRKLIKDIDWCIVEAHFNDTNKGLAESVINGVTKVINQGHESVIVLEDDCIPSEHFIRFMKEALNYYDSNEEVMHVSGFGLPIKKYTDADVYLTPYPCSWGWGTWAKYWRECNFYQNDAYTRLLEQREVVKSFNYPGEAFSTFLKMQLDGHVSSWLIRWYYHIFAHNGKCVWSYESLIKNKGFDGTGVHKVNFDRFNQKKNSIRANRTGKYKFENRIHYNPKLIKVFRRFFNGKSKWEKAKTVIYLLTGIILETSKEIRVRKWKSLN